MLQILHGTKIDFMGKRKMAYAFSALVLLAGFASLIMKGGPRPGIDFAGGTLLEVRMSQAIPADQLRHAADQAGMAGAEIQTYPGTNDALFRVHEAHDQAATPGSSPSAKLQQALAASHPGVTVEVLRQEVVGPKVGRELTGKAFMAILFSVIAIMIYVAFRFHGWVFGVGAALALFHDILVTLGIFSILNKEIGLTVLAAFLTVAGYSVNDTIVVFDRVRENLEKNRKTPLSDLMNLSINQTLSRTILTVATVMMTAAALFFLGGEVLRDFSLALLIGVGFGTYSSVYVASALALDLDNWRRRKLAAKGELAKPVPTPPSTGRKAGKATQAVASR
ncbi:MAG TPA: protein translocase subunit SecF [Candidatus Eisenbacteria bacterium]